MRMKIKDIRRILAVTATVFFMTGCSGGHKEIIEEEVVESLENLDVEDRGEDKPQAKSTFEPTEVALEGDRIILSYFDVSMTLPLGWHRMTKEELTIIEATGSAIMDTNSEVFNLIGMAQRPLDTAPVFNPSLLMNTYKGDMETTEDIMNLMEGVERSLSEEDLGFEFEPPAVTTYFKGLEGVEMRLSLQVDESLLIHQLFFVAVQEGWVLEVTATYSAEEEALFKDMLLNR